ncbi:Cox family DNA-binding protein [Candidatus Regiella endosymbiont of Tuberolachnus salignus]|uniref:Cox family DNA-binding protein n=1 Tax=Candidatus Regiella endosymbiont of Tuberolachnus salignus TaxID=3077956 RepID=UPI0030D41E0B
MSQQIVSSVSDALPYPEFARHIGKTPEAVKGMIDKGKLPTVEMRNPKTSTARAEYWVYLPAWNSGMKLAFEKRPKEIRDGWLMWLGLGEPACCTPLLP